MTPLIGVADKRSFRKSPLLNYLSLEHVPQGQTHGLVARA